MEIEIRRALLPADIDALCALDREVFAEDAFDEDEWESLEAYWLIANGMRAGCAAFVPNTDFQEDLNEEDFNPPLPGSLYIVSTGIRPDLRGKGLGEWLKRWEIKHARDNGFTRIVTNCRASNTPIIRLNEKVGFHIIRTLQKEYYPDGEPTTVMELRL